MAVSITDIKSANWQMGLADIGEVAEGLNDIKQCIQLIIITTRGTDPLRPEFGTDIYRLIDRPVNVAAPAIVLEILTGIEMWEKRVRVNKITYQIDGEKIRFSMSLQMILSAQPQTLLFEIERASQTVPVNDLSARAFSRGFSFAFA